MGLRGIERVTEIHHTTILHWIRETGLSLPDVPESEGIPEITGLDELQTFVGNKRHKIWIGCAINHKQAKSAHVGFQVKRRGSIPSCALS